MMALVTIAVGAAFASLSSAVPPATAPPAPADPVAALSLRQLAGQRIVVGYPRGDVPASLRAQVRAGTVGGVIVFDRNIPSRAHLRGQLRRLQRTSRPLDAPLLTMVDQEGGQVKRLSGAPRTSPARMGRWSADAVRAEGAATARNLRRVALDVNLAPVADVGLPGSYQHATQRAFSGRPGRAASRSSAFAVGLQSAGVAATLKHFPGLGRIAHDEDRTVQTVHAGVHTLRTVDEVPFAAGIHAGVGMVMTSTARYPALDSAPALLSRTVTTGELRERLGFQGVAITDDLDVPALRGYGGAGRLAVRATAAGNDLLLFCQTPAHARQAVDAIVRAVRQGRLSRRTLEASVRRIRGLRVAIGNAQRSP
jgi:beta-N-acetylhexosaminidase